MHWIFEVLRIRDPRYLDIGANHPRRGNNTFLFYTLGGSGVLVEPNPAWAHSIRRERPRDACIEAGVGAEASSGVPFYVMRQDALSTFSGDEAQRMVRECGEELRETRTIDVVTPEGILREHFADGRLNYVSLDVEGLELEILGAFDFDAHRPEVFCVETLSYAVDGTGRKAEGVIDFMREHGYVVHADTYVNTIFVERSSAEGRLCPPAHEVRS